MMRRVVFTVALVAMVALCGVSSVCADDAQSAAPANETYDQWLARLTGDQAKRYPLGVPEHGNVYFGYFPGHTDVSRWTGLALEGTLYPRKYLVKTDRGIRPVFYEVYGFKVGGFAAVSTVDGKTDEGYGFDEFKGRVGMKLDYYGGSRLGDRQLTLTPTIGLWSGEGGNKGSGYENTEDEKELGLRIENNIFNRNTSRTFGVFDVNMWFEGQYELNHDKSSSTLVKGKRTTIPIAKDRPKDRSSYELGLAVDLVQWQSSDQRSRLALAPVITNATGRERSNLYGFRLRCTHKMDSGRQVNFDVLWFKKDVKGDPNSTGGALGLSFPF